MKIGVVSRALPYLPSRGGFRLYGGNLIRRLSPAAVDRRTPMTRCGCPELAEPSQRGESRVRPTWLNTEECR